MTGLPGPDALAALALAAVLAGLARGFSGFGSALIFMPLAGLVMAPVQAVVVLTVMDALGPLSTLPATWRQADLRAVGRMGLGLVLGLPLGLLALTGLPADPIRWAVSGVALAMLALMLTGWRYSGPRGGAARVAVGGMSGVLGGSTGLAGPPAILFEMAGPGPVAQIRANLMLFLLGVDLAMLAGLAALGRLAPPALATGALLIPPFLLANLAGARLFRPDRAGHYRAAAYVLIGAAALMGLPVWQGGN